jgi:antitoxin HigA-1
MKDEEVSINALAQAIRVPANRISLIVNERRAITADTALQLATFLWGLARILAQHPKSV